MLDVVPWMTASPSPHSQPAHGTKSGRELRLQDAKPTLSLQGPLGNGGALESRSDRSWAARRSNQSILTEISPEYSLEGLMLKLKPQYFGQLMLRAYSLEK